MKIWFSSSSVFYFIRRMLNYEARQGLVIMDNMTITVRTKKLIKHDGFIFLNSPMFGTDDVFGTPFDVYFKEWQDAEQKDYWTDLHCDVKGWPVHGHLVWASPYWWENFFFNMDLLEIAVLKK